MTRFNKHAATFLHCPPGTTEGQMTGYFNPVVSRLVKRLTCLTPHVGGDGEGGPDGGVESKEDHPENHAPPDCQVRELQKTKIKTRE